jgi:hypothetical protein
VIFLLDVIKKFNTGFYKKGVLEMDRYLISKNYLKTLFVPDLISILAIFVNG